MSAEPKRVANPDVWTRWEGQVVKGRFPLRRFLGGSGQSAVFLSEFEGGKSSNVAIKLVPAVASRAEAQLAHWRTAAALTHPHLVRLFDMGRCQLEGREFLFVVMEYGEQTLSQFLAQRALSAGEVRALLLPTLDALAFLHSNQLVHAQLKPSNLLIVEEQLKLSSDVVRPVGHRGLATADDIWSLGATLVEACTQRTVPEQHDEVNALLANVPAQFGNTVRRCLNPTPGSRPTAAELQAQFETAPPPTDVPSDDRPHAHPLLLAVPAVLLVSLVAWISLHESGKSQVDAPAPVVPAPDRAPAPAARIEKPTRPKPKPTLSEAEPTPFRAQPASFDANPPEFVGPDTSRAVVREIKPDVPRAVRDKIQGRILVTVRVLVDSSGNVVAAMMEKAGPNKNLASLADGAAREWKFAPAEEQGNRVWVLTFAFTREGVTARATAV